MSGPCNYARRAPTMPEPQTADGFALFLEGLACAAPRVADVPPVDEGYGHAEHAPYGHTTGQHVLDPDPATDTEAAIRQHVAVLLLDILDLSTDRDVRDGALRHLITCDPGRTIGLLAQTVVTMWQINDAAHHRPTGFSARYLRDTIGGAQ